MRPMASQPGLNRKTYQPGRPSKGRFDDVEPERSSSSEDGGISQTAVQILDDIRRAVEQNPEGARAAALRLVTLLTSPGVVKAADSRGGLAPWHKRKLDRYIRNHLNQPVQVRVLAEQVGLSASHFHRAFRETFGETPKTYISRRRLELAQRLMLASSEPLTQIALDCGFADQSHLSKAFRRLMGETPSSWRRRNLTDAPVETSSFHSNKQELSEIFEIPGKAQPRSRQ
jgi:AraC family transcriptional regulator